MSAHTGQLFVGCISEFASDRLQFLQTYPTVGRWRAILWFVVELVGWVYVVAERPMNNLPISTAATDLVSVEATIDG